MYNGMVNRAIPPTTPRHGATQGDYPMSTKTVTIAGHSFDLNAPYSAGHVVTEAEAKTLNQTRHENVRNNLAKAVKELIEAGKMDEAKAKVAEYDASYEFTMASVGGGATRLDPVEREARAIAKELVRAHLAKTNRTFKTVPEGMTAEAWAEKVEANIASVAASENVMKEARKAVAAKGKRLESLASELDLG